MIDNHQIKVLVYHQLLKKQMRASRSSR